LREPLLAPLAAIAAGIVVSRVVPFESRELVPGSRRSSSSELFASIATCGGWRSLARCLPSCRGVWSTSCIGPGRLRRSKRRPRAADRFGCVVEPPVFFEAREQFILELDPGARARVNLYLRDGETAPPLRYGQRVEFEAASARRAISIIRIVRLRRISRPEKYLLDRLDRAGARIEVLPERAVRVGRRFCSAFARRRSKSWSRCTPGSPMRRE